MAAGKFGAALGSADFRILLLGESVSVFGTQFNMVALQWLAVSSAADAALLATLLTVASLPRALLMLFAGALVDRLPARRIMALCNAARFVLSALLAAATATDPTGFAVVAGLILAIGIADAFFLPAYMAIVPRIVAPDAIGGANALMQAVGQLVAALGPALAGAIIGRLSVAAGFGIDALSFLVAGIALVFVREPPPAAAAGPRPSLAVAALAGLRHAWTDRPLRALLGITVAINLAFMGPYVVGTALLVEERFKSASALGILLGAWGLGAIVGNLVAGMTSEVRGKGRIAAGLPVAIGLGVATLAFARDFGTTFAIRALVGALTGFANTFTLTLLQRTVQRAYLGRVMGAVMLLSFGMHPLSYALAGALSPLGSAGLFALSGAALCLTGVAALSSGALRTLGSAQPADAPLA